MKVAVRILMASIQGDHTQNAEQNCVEIIASRPPSGIASRAPVAGADSQ